MPDVLTDEQMESFSNQPSMPDVLTDEQINTFAQEEVPAGAETIDENPYTALEKFVVGALPIAGAIGGGVLGGLGTTPTIAGIPAGVLAGGAAGAAGGRGLADVLEEKFGGTERDPVQILKRSAVEGALDVPFTIAGVKIGKVLGKVFKPVTRIAKKYLGGLAAPVIAHNFATSQVDDITKGIAKAEKGIKLKEQFIKQGLSDNIFKLTKEAGVEVSKLAPDMAKIGMIAKEEMDVLYGQFNKKYGKVLVTGIDDAIDSTRKILATDGVAIDDPLVKSAKSLLNKYAAKPKTVRNAINFKRDINAKLRAIFNSPTSASDTVGQTLKKTKASLDKRITQATGKEYTGIAGRSKELFAIDELTESMFGVQKTTKAAKALKLESIGRFGEALEQEFKKKSGIEMTEYGSKVTRGLYRQIDALKEVGTPRALEYASKIEKKLKSIIGKGLSVKNINQNINNLRRLGIAVTDAEIAQLNKEITGAQVQKNIFEKAAKEIDEKVLGKGSLLPIFIAGNAVGQLPFLPQKVRNTVLIATNLFTISKWSPQAANILLKSIRRLESRAAQETLTQQQKVVISKFIKSGYLWMSSAEE